MIIIFKGDDSIAPHVFLPALISFCRPRQYVRLLPTDRVTAASDFVAACHWLFSSRLSNSRLWIVLQPGEFRHVEFRVSSL